MAKLSLNRANRIISQAFAHAKEAGYKPLAVVVLDDGGNLKAFQAQDGSSNNRFEIARGKVKGALAVGTGSRWLNTQAETRPHFLDGLSSVIDSGIVAVPGGVLAKDKSGNIIAAVGISGDTSDADEECAIKGIEAVNLIADPGA
ncbi:MAG: heme-binding protein [Rhizobiaceae bacterium]|nr:heme-binding protein [Rhizobiaceae bacterium]